VEGLGFTQVGKLLRRGMQDWGVGDAMHLEVGLVEDNPACNIILHQVRLYVHPLVTCPRGVNDGLGGLPWHQ
jgi:hypothetical protein